MQHVRSCSSRRQGKQRRERGMVVMVSKMNTKRKRKRRTKSRREREREMMTNIKRGAESTGNKSRRKRS
jgi:hypothetical protein